VNLLAAFSGIELIPAVCNSPGGDAGLFERFRGRAAASRDSPASGDAFGDAQTAFVTARRGLRPQTKIDPTDFTSVPRARWGGWPSLRRDGDRFLAQKSRASHRDKLGGGAIGNFFTGAQI